MRKELIGKNQPEKKISRNEQQMYETAHVTFKKQRIYQ